ncbi:unnamed protein product [Schistocephalus solidus]|uniref:Uncharacterized protein n=1 Tax=Schistocephalus solidus TaxID=70667 RepID=A0A183TT93_SCHSO|nr:unnamed protein product [Schistocephalus solidus]
MPEMGPEGRGGCGGGDGGGDGGGSSGGDDDGGGGVTLRHRLQAAPAACVQSMLQVSDRLGHDTTA